MKRFKSFVLVLISILFAAMFTPLESEDFLTGFTGLKRDAQITLGYLSVGRNNHILVVDFSADKVVGKIYGGEAPAWIRATYDGKQIWVLNWRTLTTTVIHTEKNDVRIRGISNPIFAHDNRRYFVVSSDASAIFEVDYIARELLSQTPILIKDYWRGALTPDDHYLYITQMNIAGFVDPNAPKVTYDSIAVYDTKEKKLVKNVKVGLNPHDVQITPNGRYAIVANKTTDDISIIDTKSIENVLTVKVGKLCRAILIRPDGKQIVITTDGREGMYEVEAEEEINGEIYSYWTDFGDKPKVEFHKMLKTGGFPEFGGFTPDGKKLILLKRGKAPEILILEPKTLALKNRIPTAAGAIEVAFAPVPEEVRDRMIKEGPPNRKFLSELINKAKAQGAGFQDVVLTEVVEEYDSRVGGTSEKSGEPKRFEQKVYFKSPAFWKVETPEGKASIWKDGILMSEKEARRGVPEVDQNLQYLPFTLYSSTFEQFLHQLTGDIEGKGQDHRLSVAADVMHTKKVDGREVYVIGASEGGTTSTQIWLDKQSLLITYLLESIPFARLQREIRFSDYRKVDGKFMIPFKAEVYVNGKLESRREIKEAKFNIGLKDDLFHDKDTPTLSLDQFITNRIRLTENKTIFTVFAFLNAAGYDEENNPNGMHPVRKRVRERLFEVTPGPLKERVQTFYQKHRAEPYTYTVVTMATSGPPEFRFTEQWREIADRPRFSALAELPALLRDFYAAVPIEAIYEGVRGDYQKAVEGYLSAIQREVSKVMKYCRVQSPAELAGRGEVVQALVIPNFLLSYEYAFAFVWQDTLYSIEGPQNGPPDQWGYNPHEFIHSITNPVSYDERYRPQQQRAQPLFEAAMQLPEFQDQFKTKTITHFFDECLVRAIALKYLDTRDPKWTEQLRADMMDEYRQGYILERFFYEQLEAYEKSEAALRDYYPLMLQHLDIEKGLARWKQSREVQLKYHDSLQKIFEIQNKIRDIHPFLEKTFPIAIVEGSYFFIFDADSSKKRYIFIKKAPTPMPIAKGVRAAFPLQSYGGKMVCVISGEVFESLEGYASIFHEFLHCYQFEICEQKLKEKLDIAQKAMAKKDYAWELNHPFPYDNNEFTKTYSLFLKALEENKPHDISKYRSELKRILAKNDFEYMVWQEWKEGLARFIENQVRLRLDLEENHYVGEPFSRISFYEGGARFIEFLSKQDPRLLVEIERLFYKMLNGER
ncbi:MAG: beta-propeller fold lactonase family protein [Acidobacteriota bacterium]